MDQVGSDALRKVEGEPGEQFSLHLVRTAHAAKAQFAAVHQR